MLKKEDVCLQMLENPSKLDALLKILKSNGVQEFTMGGVSMKFTHFIHLPAENIGKFIDKNESKDEEDEELMYYSAR
jgi:hypothetical protein